MTRAEAKFIISNYEFGHVPHRQGSTDSTNGNFFVDMGLSLKTIKTNVSNNCDVIKQYGILGFTVSL